MISTIHQPSSKAFKIFDRLIFMMDGYIAYQGLAKESTAHFAKLGMICPTTSNPADYFMRVLTVNYPKTEEEDTHVAAVVNHYN